MAVYQTSTGWGFVLGQHVHEGFSTKEAAQESQYDAERGTTPSLSSVAEQVITDVIDSASRDQALAVIAEQRPAVEYKRVASSSPDGPGWDRYDRGEVRLDIEARGGTLCFGGEALDLNLNGLADLLDLRVLLNDARVLAQLELMYELD